MTNWCIKNWMINEILHNSFNMKVNYLFKHLFFIQNWDTRIKQSVIANIMTRVLPASLWDSAAGYSHDSSFSLSNISNLNRLERDSARLLWSTMTMMSLLVLLLMIRPLSIILSRPCLLQWSKFSTFFSRIFTFVFKIS